MVSAPSIIERISAAAVATKVDGPSCAAGGADVRDPGPAAAGGRGVDGADEVGGGGGPGTVGRVVSRTVSIGGAGSSSRRRIGPTVPPRDAPGRAPALPCCAPRDGVPPEGVADGAPRDGAAPEGVADGIADDIVDGEIGCAGGSPVARARSGMRPCAVWRRTLSRSGMARALRRAAAPAASAVGCPGRRGGPTAVPPAAVPGAADPGVAGRSTPVRAGRDDPVAGVVAGAVAPAAGAAGPVASARRTSVPGCPSARTSGSARGTRIGRVGAPMPTDEAGRRSAAGACARASGRRTASGVPAGFPGDGAAGEAAIGVVGGGIGLP